MKVRINSGLAMSGYCHKGIQLIVPHIEVFTDTTIRFSHAIQF